MSKDVPVAFLPSRRFRNAELPWSLTVMFPELHAYSDDSSSMYTYVEHILVELAKTGDLFLTALMNQGELPTQLAMDVIHGRRLNAGHYDPAPSPDELRDHRVRIVAIPWRRRIDAIGPDGRAVGTGQTELVVTPIEFREKTLVQPPTMNKAQAALAGKPFAQGQAAEWRERVVESGLVDCVMGLPDAVQCLKQYGMFCAPGASTAARSWRWRCREVNDKHWPLGDYTPVEGPWTGPAPELAFAAPPETRQMNTGAVDTDRFKPASEPRRTRKAADDGQQ